jgi:ATP-dependent DNA helicase RecG
MPTTPEQFQAMLSAAEGTRLEFKEAKGTYPLEDLANYCVALANEGGGRIVLGVTDKRPRSIVGTQAFPEPGQAEYQLHQVLHHRIPVEEYFHEGRRVVIVHVPARLPGTAWNHKGAYKKRAGQALVAMGEAELKAIFSETGTDFTAELVPGADYGDLQTEAVFEFCKRWHRRNPSLKIDTMPPEQALANAELTVDGSITYAALILLGRPSAITRHLAQAELVFEYRSSEASGPAADREEYREPFLLYHDRLWNKINLRNDRQSYQDDFFRYDIPTFDEVAIREGILNAVCHRDYRHGGSVFVKQYSRRLEILSPGGFPPGVTAENIADQQNPRNRRLAEAMQRCGFIERAGQGVNLMIENAIRQTKPLPDFSGSTAHEVRLILSGTVQNPAFIRFIERLGEDQLRTFGTMDFLTLEALSRGLHLSDAMKQRLPRLKDVGAVESQGRGRGIRYFLSRELYAEMGSPGTYTRERGLDHETNKALLERHLQDRKEEGAPLADLCQVLPACSARVVQRLLHELQDEHRAHLVGLRRWARWYAESFKPPGLNQEQEML